MYGASDTFSVISNNNPHTTLTNVGTSSFYSLVSEDERGEGKTVFRFEETTVEAKEFCLDIDKLERVASRINCDLPCRIRRTPQFDRATYFFLRADFIGGHT